MPCIYHSKGNIKGLHSKICYFSEKLWDFPMPFFLLSSIHFPSLPLLFSISDNSVSKDHGTRVNNLVQGNAFCLVNFLPQVKPALPDAHNDSHQFLHASNSTQLWTEHLWIQECCTCRLKGFDWKSSEPGAICISSNTHWQ